MRNRVFLILLAMVLAFSLGIIGCTTGEEEEEDTYDLTIASTSGGSVTTPGEGAFTYDEDKKVNLTAKPDEGYYFVNWIGDVHTIDDVDAPVTTIAMNGDYSITANFRPVQWRLSISVTEGGSVTSPGEEISTYDNSAVVELVAEAEEGYQFINWTGDVDTIADVNAGSTTVTMNGDYTITAGFAKAIWTWYDLDAIRDNLDGSYLLMNDLDTSTVGYAELASATADQRKGWEPIRDFTGCFDGQGYEVKNLFIDRPTEGDVGLFGVLDGGSVIEDIGVVNADVLGGESVGILVGLNHYCTVIDSYATGSVAGSQIGGLVGRNCGVVSNSHYNYDEVLINGRKIITAGALFAEDFEQWLANDKFLDVDERLSQEDGYYMIDDVSDFKELLPFGQDASLRFRLNEDLNLASEANFYIPYLAGEFDGNGHRILNPTFSFDFVSQVGLFGILASGGRIAELGVENVAVMGCEAVGSLVGRNSGTISSSHSTGSVTGTDTVGCLVGGNGGTIRDSYCSGSVTGQGSVGGLLGGVMGWNIISNSYYNYDEVLINGRKIITAGALFAEDFEQWLANDKFLDVDERLSQEDGYYMIDDVSDFKELLPFGQDASLRFRLNEDLNLASEANFYIPYLAGEFDGNGHRILNPTFSFDFVSQVGLFGCLASGGEVNNVVAENVNISAGGHVGGLVGDNQGTVSNCYCTGNVAGHVGVGGLVGWNWNTVERCCFSGSVTGHGFVGGLVGFHDWNTVNNCYANGSVTGGSEVGGLIGSNCEGMVTNCYSAASVTGDTNVGGLVARSSGIDHPPVVSNSFWDLETSGMEMSDGGTGKTTAEMHDIATFSGADWNIAAVAPDERNTAYTWNIVDGQTYPFLSWQS